MPVKVQVGRFRQRVHQLDRHPVAGMDAQDRPCVGAVERGPVHLKIADPDLLFRPRAGSRSAPR